MIGALVIAALVGSCGSDGQRGPVVIGAGMAEVTSFRVEFRQVGPDGGEAEGAGAVDLPARQAMFSFGPPTEFSLSVEVAIDGENTYLRYPGAGVDGFELGWFESEPAAPVDHFGVSVDEFALLDPGRLLGLIGLADEVSDLGREQVRDRDATHYRLQVGPIAFYDHIGEIQDRELLARTLAERGLETVPVEVWVDEANRVVRLRTTMPSRCGGETSSELEFFDFDEPVEVVVPAPEDVHREEAVDRQAPEPCPPPDPRDVPVPLGESGEVFGWTVSVIEVDLDASDELEAVNELHDPPPESQAEVGIRLRLTYNGGDPTAPLHQLAYSAVTDEGIYDAYDYSCDGAMPDGLDYLEEVRAAETIERAICRVIPDDELDSLLLLVSEAFNSRPEELYFTLRD